MKRKQKIEAQKEREDWDGGRQEGSRHPIVEVGISCFTLFPYMQYVYPTITRLILFSFTSLSISISAYIVLILIITIVNNTCIPVHHIVHQLNASSS